MAPGEFAGGRRKISRPVSRLEAVFGVVFRLSGGVRKELYAAGYCGQLDREGMHRLFLARHHAADSASRVTQVAKTEERVCDLRPSIHTNN